MDTDISIVVLVSAFCDSVDELAGEFTTTCVGCDCSAETGAGAGGAIAFFAEGEATADLADDRFKTDPLASIFSTGGALLSFVCS